MNVGTTNRGKCTLLLSMAFQAFCLYAYGELDDVSHKRYWTGQTNIVATVSAYELMTHLPSGEVIPVYSTNVYNLCTNYYAILFYVVSPPEISGKYFRLEEHEPKPIFSSGYLPPSYQLGKLYYFPYKAIDSYDAANKESWFGIISTDLFSIPASFGKKLFVGKIAGGNAYYSTQQEAVAALDALKKEHDDIEVKMRSLSNEIRKTSLDKKKSEINNDPLFRRLRGRFFDLKMGCLPSNEYKQKEVEMQIENLKNLEQTRSSNAVEK